jgi:hypothetical protein
MQQQLKDDGVNFPEWFKEELIVDKLLNLHGEELYEYFGVKTSAALSRKFNPHFPNRPARQSFCDYIKAQLAKPVKAKWSPGMQREVIKENSWE